MKKTRKREWAEALALGALVCLVCALPYASSDLRAGHDAIFHILRIEGLAAALKGGVGWPARVYSLICGGYGYAAGIFYPDIFLLPGAVARALVLGPELAFKLIMLYTVALTCLTAYLAGRNMGHSHLAGLYTMVLYNLCHYHLGNLFVRSAVGECMAMAFVPLVFWGLYDLTEEKFSKPWLLSLAFTGLVLTHTISLAVCGMAAIVWVLARLPRVLDGKIILKGVGAVGACLALTAFYWGPMLEQFASDTFKVSEEPLTHLQYNVLSVGEYLNLRDFKSPGLWFLAALLACVCLLLLNRMQGKPVGLPFGLTVGAAVTAVLPLQGLLPWDRLDETFLSAVQFPWRFFFLSQFLLSLALALLLARLDKGEWAVMTVCLLVCLSDFALLWGQLPEQVNYHKNYFTAQRGETFYLVGFEWVPAGVNVMEFAFEPEAQYTNAEGAHQGAYLPNGDFVFRYEGRPGAYGIPKLWYKGYSAQLNGQPLELRKDGGGRVELNIPDTAQPGTVTVSYTGTTAQKVSGWLSYAALLGLLMPAGFRWKKRRKKQ